MDAHGSQFGLLALPLVLLAAAVISVPLARFARLSAIVAYLVAGVVIGPYGLRLFSTPESIVPVAELGVVMLLFLIGLELELSRLLAMRRDIFGLGVAQLVHHGGRHRGARDATGLFGWRAALVAGLALALSATSIALRILEERGHLQQRLRPARVRDPAVPGHGGRAAARADAAAGAIRRGATQHSASPRPRARAALIGGAIAALVVAGRYLLNPFFRLLAWTGAREVMTAAALLIVLGAGAADAERRHVDGARRVPRRRAARGIDLPPRARSRHRAVPRPAAGAVLHGRRHDDRHEDRVGEPVARHRRRARHHAAQGRRSSGRCSASPARGAARRLRAGSVLTGAGEFAFVLLPLGVTLGVLSATQGSLLSAIAAVTLLIGPPFASLTERAGAPSCARATSARPTTSRRARLGAGHRLRPLRADRVAISAGRGDRRHHDRPRSRDDPGRRRVSASRSTTATARGSTCCARPASRRRG